MKKGQVKPVSNECAQRLTDITNEFIQANPSPEEFMKAIVEMNTGKGKKSFDACNKKAEKALRSLKKKMSKIEELNG